MEGWMFGVLAAAGLVAVRSLVKLMVGRRNALLVELNTQAEAERRKQPRPSDDESADPSREAA